MKYQMLVLLGIFAAAGAIADTTVTELNLTEDVTIDVPEGETTSIERLSGGAFTITKTGSGTIRFGFVKNTAAKMILRDGSYAYYVPAKPAIMASAILHVDANVLNDDYVETVNGTNFVNRWEHASDSASTYYASHDATVVGTWRTDTGNRRPFVNKGYLNGLDVIDFGSYLSSKVVDAQGQPDGYGAGMTWNKASGAVRDVYEIAGYSEDIATVKTLHPDVGNATGLIGAYYNAFVPYSLAADGKNPMLVNRWQNAANQLAYQTCHGDIFYNDTQVSSAETPYAGQTVPLGMLYINVRPVAPAEGQSEKATIDAFAHYGTDSYGGQRIGEFAAFATRLSDADHDAVENYLRAKWLPQKLAEVYDDVTLELVADAEITVPAGTTADVARVSGGAYTLTKRGAGTVRFGFIQNRKAKLVVEDGAVDFYVPDAPAVLREAFVHFDANVLDAQYVTEENGTNFVSRWTDASGGARYASTTGNRPYVAPAFQNGLDVMDFGSYRNASVAGYGASLLLNESCTGIRDVFAVTSYREEIRSIGSNNATPLVGMTSSGNCAFLPYNVQSTGNNPPLINYWQNRTAQVQYGEVWYNDVHEDGSSKGTAGRTAIPLGMFYLNIRPTDIDKAGGKVSVEGAYSDALARQDSTTYGGQRIGEYALFTRRLSDFEHDRVENYLRAKWFPQRFASVTVASAAKLRKADAGKTRVTTLTGTPDVEVVAGTLEVDPLSDVGAWIHLDATRLDDYYVTDGADGKRLVSLWKDADGGVYSAKSKREGAAPYLTTGAEGLPVMDFGKFKSSVVTDGWGAYMGFCQGTSEKTCSTIREILVIAEDREESATLGKDYTNPGNAAPFVGGVRTGSTMFFRDAFTTTGVYPLLLNPWQQLTRGIWGYENGISVDGVMKTPGTTAIRLGAGLHLVDFRMTANGGATGLASDETGTSGYGGVRIGEVMVFEQELEGSVRDRIVQTLMNKWLGADPFVYACGAVSVSKDAVLAFPNAAVSATSLTLGGTVKAEKVASGAFVVTGTAATVNGTLDLSAPGTVELDEATFGGVASGTVVRVLSAANVVGDVKGWTAVGGLAERRRVRLSVQADGLYAKISDPSGCLILVQ